MNIHETLKFITTDGETFNLHSPPTRWVTQQTGWGMSAYATRVTRGPFQHSQRPVNLRLDPRTVEIQLRHNACGRSDYWGTRSSLIDVLRPNRGALNNPSTGVLRRSYWQDRAQVTRDVEVWLRDGLLFNDPVDVWDSWGVNETLVFEALDPVIFDPTAVTATVTTFTAHLVLPIVYPFILGASVATENITYTGTWFSFPIIEIDGPTDGFTIINNSTGYRISLDYHISAGETVTINLAQDEKTVVSDVSGNQIANIVNSQLGEFVLQVDPIVAGGVNELLIYTENPEASTEVRITYNNRYIGI